MKSLVMACALVLACCLLAPGRAEALGCERCAFRITIINDTVVVIEEFCVEVRRGGFGDCSTDQYGCTESVACLLV